MYGLKLILILAVMGGAIAYIGDKLGMKIGRKKLSLFKLRPKHTSIVVTIVTGILISGTTLGILTLVSRDVRTALFGMEALQKEMSYLSSEVKAKTGDLENTREMLSKREQEIKGITVDIGNKAAQLSSISTELAAVIEQRNKTLTALEEARGHLTLTQRDLSSAREQITSLETTKHQLDERVITLTQSKEKLGTEVKSLSELAENLKSGIRILREGDVVYRSKEVLGVTVIQGGTDRKRLEQEVTAFIQNTNHQILRELGRSDENVQLLWVAQSDFDKIVRALQETQEGVVVRLSSEGNTVFGQAVVGRFDLFINHIIFQKGDLLFKDTIDTSVSGGTAEPKIMLALQEINKAAIQKGMLADPLQGTVGSVSGIELFNAVNEAKKLGGKVEVSIYAREDTYTVGPLKIQIVVTRGY